MTGSYFVYQAWTEDRLYASSLTEEDAAERAGELDRLIASGRCGNGCAVIGNLLDESDFLVAQRLGLADRSSATWNEWIASLKKKQARNRHQMDKRTN